MQGVADKEFFIDNLLIRIHFMIEMIWWTSLAQWELEFPFPDSLIYTFLYTRPQKHFESGTHSQIRNTKVELCMQGGAELEIPAEPKIPTLSHKPSTLNLTP